MKRYFIAGLLVWLPILVTIFIIRIMVEFLDKGIALLPMKYRPEAWLGMHIPGFGVVVSILVLFITGVVVTNIFGVRIVAMWERLIQRIPFIRSIHSGVKQVLEALFTTKEQSFRQVLLVEYPRKGLWSVAFQTAGSSDSITAKANQHDMVTIFIPTTPNPTSGFLMMVPKEDVVKLDISVDEALKFVVSLGIIQPGAKKTIEQ